MRNRKKNSRFQKSTAALLAVAMILLAGSAVGSTRAALTYFSDNYSAQMNTPELGVTLVENGKDVTADDEGNGSLLADMTGVKPGQKYTEELAVKNSGDIGQYVRVRIYRSWADKEGEKDTTLSPSYIELNTLPGNGWIEDETARTTERSVWYYTRPLESGETTELLTDSVRIDDAVASKVAEKSYEKDGKIVTEKVYAYDGYTFSLTAEADAVQNHNAADAIKSAWGVDVAMSGDTITGVTQGGE